MKVSLRFLDGIVTIEDQNIQNITSEMIYNVIKEHTGAIKPQIVVSREVTDYTSQIKDGDIFNIVIKPIFEISYVNGYDVSKYYLKNDTTIQSHADKVIWMNQVSFRKAVDGSYDYELIKWDTEKGFVQNDRVKMTKEQLQTLHDSDTVSPIAKKRIWYFVQQIKD